MWSLPKPYEDALWDACESLPRDRKALLGAIAERTLRYTSERQRLNSSLGAQADTDLAARALFYTVADAAKVLIPMAELRSQGLLAAKSLRVADLGAGCGAMTFGLLASDADTEYAVDAFDSDARALRVHSDALRALPSELSGRVQLRTHAGDLRKTSAKGPYDLVVACGLLNEMSEDEAHGLVMSWMEVLDEGGAMVIIEPALREQSRQVHRLRDRVLRSGSVFVFAPCTRQLEGCPALDAEGDWCHEVRATRLPKRAAELSRATGLRDGGLKFSYLVLRRQRMSLVSEPEAARVVSSIRKLKGRHECYLCCDRGRRRVRLLKRERSEHNECLLDAKRGDLVLGVVEERVKPEHSLRVLSPAKEPGST